MSETEKRIRRLLLDVVPEAADEELSAESDLREALDIDSMDHLNFLVSVAEAFGIEIPEQDYGELVTLADVARYVEVKGSR